MEKNSINRKEFLQKFSVLGAGVVLAPMAVKANQFYQPDKKIKVAVIGCGSVSTQYLPHLSKSPFVELVSTCDIIHQRAIDAAKKYNIPNHYPHIDQLLAGAPFDLMITLTEIMGSRTSGGSLIIIMLDTSCTQR